MTKHPTDRATRLYINEKKKRRKIKPKEKDDEELVESSE